MAKGPEKRTLGALLEIQEVLRAECSIRIGDTEVKRKMIAGRAEQIEKEIESSIDDEDSSGSTIPFEHCYEFRRCQVNSLQQEQDDVQGALLLALEDEEHAIAMYAECSAKYEVTKSFVRQAVKRNMRSEEATTGDDLDDLMNWKLR